ncbi:MAG: beta galactosidase jelly roll domain-containing protein [Chitinispirillaceae bacterium]|nr:beta galactosidase jelly roll domain-containing protein [Chitinispirillaceae bacterium]
MFFKNTRLYALPIFLCMLSFTLHPEIYQPPVPQKLERKTNMNMNWHFYRGTLSGAEKAEYNDSGTGWSSVALPHSCSYDSAPVVVTGEANWASEANYYKGNCWYRKTFGVPENTKKLFIEFEGAMQVATVYINGNRVGLHDNSGYTPFYFDITKHIIRGENNVVAVMLDNSLDNDIPPGSTPARPDYLLYSGLYRSVWLHAKDSVYIPIYSQHVRTDNVSASSAQVHAITPVTNDGATEKKVTVTVTLYDSTHTGVINKSSTLPIPAKSTDTVDILTDAVANPHLWSPSDPYMYSVQTVVSVDGATVDSVVEPCGFRFISWTAGPGGSFTLNGSRLEIRGMNVHQFQGWMENAVPDTRLYLEVKLVKSMGCNSIRCAHYPRSQSFYDACDKLGMLVYVEPPTWGWGYTPSARLWSRLDSCIKEMVTSARNHPCVYLWGLYNEPATNSNFTSQMTVLNNTAHRLDPTRFTVLANFRTGTAARTVPDVQGLNYATAGDANARWLNTESRTGFYWHSYRGSPVDLDTSHVDHENGNAYQQWLQMAFTMNTSDQLSGGYFWCFKDYNSPCNLEGNEGVVDRLTVPKTIFYMFRQYWTGLDPDYPRNVTPTTIELRSDTLGPLHANGADVFLLTTTMRDGAGSQSSTANGPVTYTVSPASGATIFGGNRQPAYAGRAGVFLRTTTTPATITVTAAYGNLPPASITLTTVQDTNHTPPFGAVSADNIASQQGIPEVSSLHISSSVKDYLFHCPRSSAGRLSIIDLQGRTAFVRDVGRGDVITIPRRMLGTGIYFGMWDDGLRQMISRINAGL